MTKTEKTIGIVLASLLMLLTLSGTWYFLAKLGVTPLQWTMFNACSPTSLVYLLGFVLFLRQRKAVWLAIALLPMYYFGTMGMFTFNWSEVNIFAQLSHIAMTLNIIWALYIVFKQKDYQSFSKGLGLSILIFVPYIVYVMYYCRTHADEVTNLLQMN